MDNQTFSGSTLHVVSVDPCPPDSDPDDQQDEPRFEDMGFGLEWGIDVAQTLAVTSKRECWVVDPLTLDILYRIRNADIVIH